MRCEIVEHFHFNRCYKLYFMFELSMYDVVHAGFFCCVLQKFRAIHSQSILTQAIANIVIISPYEPCHNEYTTCIGNKSAIYNPRSMATIATTKLIKQQKRQRKRKVNGNAVCQPTFVIILKTKIMHFGAGRCDQRFISSITSCTPKKSYVLDRCLV